MAGAAEPVLTGVPPHDIEAEMAVLGALLVEGYYGDDKKQATRVVQALAPEDFYRGANRRLFQVLRALHVAGQPLDPIVVFRELERLGLLQETGGREYLAALASAVASPSNATHYAGIVAELARRRALIQIASDLQRDAYEGCDPTTDLATRTAGRIQERVAARAAAGTRRRGLLPKEMDTAADDATQWLWTGFLARGALTIFAGQPKAGKSYLLWALLGHLERGEPFCGMEVAKAGALLLSEEGTSTLRTKRDRFGVEKALIHPRTHAFPRRPWAEIVKGAVEEARAEGCDLLVIDTLAYWAALPQDAEKDSGAMSAAMAPLLEAATSGLAVFVVHHLRKAGGEAVGDGMRGSNAITASADVLMEYRVSKSAKDRRSLSAVSRWEVTPPNLVVELDGAGYRVLGDERLAAARDDAKRLVGWLREHPWQDGDTIQDALQIQRRRLRAMLAEGVVSRALDRVGDGTRSDPFRYAVVGTSRP